MVVGKNFSFYIITFMFFLLLNLQTFTIKGFFIDASVKVHHLFSLIVLALVIYICLNVKLIFPKNIILFFGYISIQSLFFYFINSEFNQLLINYFYCFILFIIGYYIVHILGMSVVNKILKQVTLVMIMLTVVKLVFNIEEVIRFSKDPYGHPVMNWFYGGGPNLESTWISLGVVFFMKNKYFYLVFFFALFISIIYASRVGTIILVLILLIKFIHSKLEVKIVILIFSLIGLILFLNHNPYLIERFTSVGKDTGSLSRLAIWKYVFEGFINYPILGSGAGNAMNVLESISGKIFIEDNVHNYYFQILLEFGLIGLLLYLSIVFHILKSSFTNKFTNSLEIYLLIYFIIGLIQFRGAEPIGWFIIGIYFFSINFRGDRIKKNEDYT